MHKAKAIPPSTVAAPAFDDYHGHRITDTYRWLEDGESAETKQFVEQQNDATRRVLDRVPGRENLRARIEQLLVIGRVASPRVAGDQYLYERRDGRENQPIIYVRRVTRPISHNDAGLQNQEHILVDVNALSPDGTISLDWWFPSDDGMYVAYGISADGSELSTLYIVETSTGALLPEKIERTRAASVAWLPDSSGFYYTRYPRPGDVSPGQEMYNRRVFFHKISGLGNENGLQDALVFPADTSSNQDLTVDPQHWPNISISKDGRWLLVDVSEGWTKTELYLKDLSALEPGGFLRLTTGENCLYHGVILDSQLYITTNEGAPRHRVFKADCAHPQRSNWKEIISQADAVIEEQATIIGRKLFVHYVKNAASQLRIFQLDGHPVADVPMPSLGSIFDLGGSWNSDTAFFGFISYAVPPTIYEVSLEGKPTLWARVESGIDPDQYQVEQLWFTSKDGTRIPMFVVSNKGLVRDGRNPTLLSGYGGFNLGRMPFFNRNVMLLLLEHGGVYVDVQLR